VRREARGGGWSGWRLWSAKIRVYKRVTGVRSGFEGFKGDRDGRGSAEKRGHHGVYRTQGKWLRRGERRAVKWVEAMEW